MNVEILENLEKFLVKNPDKLNMDEFMNSCGTVGCFAGWICLLNDPVVKENFPIDEFDNYDYATKATELIDLPENITDRLFFPGMWEDENLQRKYNELYFVCAPKQKAEIALEYLRKFTKKYRYYVQEEENDDE
jgi:hypothetical protein